MRVAIVGFPFSGKTCLFQAISGATREHLKASEENVRVVHIPDPRLEFLEKLYKPKRRTEATLEFVDLPGSAEGDVQKAGLERHIPTLRQVDALLLIVRAFRSEAVPPHKGRIDPEADLTELRQEMLLADFTICAGRIEKLEKAVAKATKDKDQQKHELELLKRCQSALEQEKPLRSVVQPGDEEKLLRSFGFLTQKPTLTIINIGEENIGRDPPLRDPHAVATLGVCAPLEADLLQMPPEERPAFMREYGIQALARDRIIHLCTDALGLVFMLTVGSEEVRAWPLPRGTTAIEAAAKIHTDLARGFIKAETVAFADLYTAGSIRDAKAAGKVRLEPKSYVVQDGDVITVKFSV